MITIGPFFIIGNKFIYNLCPLKMARKQFDKLDNSYSHEQLYDDNFHTGDYIDYPRGRVVWDLTNDRSIVYIDPCINKPSILKKIQKAFELEDYVIESDEHYHCKSCADSVLEGLFDER